MKSVSPALNDANLSMPKNSDSFSVGASSKADKAEKTKSKKDRTARTEPDGQEATLKMKVVKDNLPDLEKLMKRAEILKETISDKIKAIAKDSGFHASNIKSFAKANVDADAAKRAKRNATQMAILFECEVPFALK